MNISYKSSYGYEVQSSNEVQSYEVQSYEAQSYEVQSYELQSYEAQSSIPCISKIMFSSMSTKILNFFC